jgi:HEAT repeat protein
MGRLFWPLALVLAFFIGWAAGGVTHRRPSMSKEREEAPQETVSRLQQQVMTLQARLHARDTLAAKGQAGETGSASAGSRVYSRDNGSAYSRGPVFVAPGSAEDRLFAQSVARLPGGRQPQAGSSADRGSSQSGPQATAATAPTVEAALERFYRYLDALDGADGRERWQRARELLNDLRGMGDVAGQALMHVLAAGADADERRTAARLLGNLQVSQALPLLQDVLARDSDVLLRRAAASGLRQLQSPDSVPVMERLLANPGEDRFVRLSAAAGLADSGRALGVTGLAQIFEESNVDGRGREMAFRALTSLNDDRPLPFMRQVAVSEAEPSYRLQAIRYLVTQGDRQSLGVLQVLMNSPTEQPSIRDAATQGYMRISTK